MKWHKNWSWIVFTIGLLIILAIPTAMWMHRTNKSMAQRRKSLMSPVIMVPGSSATIDRFNELVDLLNQGTQRKHSLLKVKVANSGTLSFSGTIRKGDNEPFIVVGFENNKDGYDNIKIQTKLFNKAFSRIEQQYKFNNFKAFGHSNGGLIWTNWLENYYSDYSKEITITKLMTLGTPFNFNEGSVQHKTQMLTDFIAKRNRIPKTLIVISVSGGENYESDGLVPENSVASGKYIYQGQVAHYTTMTVTGISAQHSSLPQNQQVVEVIKQYLLNSSRSGRRSNNIVR